MFHAGRSDTLTAFSISSFVTPPPVVFIQRSREFSGSKGEPLDSTLSTVKSRLQSYTDLPRREDVVPLGHLSNHSHCTRMIPHGCSTKRAKYRENAPDTCPTELAHHSCPTPETSVTSLRFGKIDRHMSWLAGQPTNPQHTSCQKTACRSVRLIQLCEQSTAAHTANAQSSR